jgi:GH25 family lysozyme M1 (1,4-beta-N-acetylmuramidase)
MPNARWVARYYNNNASDTNIINMAGKGYKIWQFTDRGVVSGVPNSGSTDLNTLIEKYW